MANGGADPRHVLALTFTRKAAGELSERLAALGVRDQVAAGTFHAIAYAQLRRRWADRGQNPPAVLDRKFIVRPRESIEWTRRLLDECGIFAGISSGAVMAGVAKMAATMDAGTIVALVPDAGWKYLSSGAWTDDLDVVTERAQRINYW